MSRIAVVPGSFDPVTLGHLSIIERGARLFDRLWVVVAVNPNKQPLFSTAERVEMIGEVAAHLGNVSCASTEGFVVDFARQYGARYLIRGVRSCTDVDGEIALAHMNRELAPEVETVFVPAHAQLSEVSSSRLKELARQGMDTSQYCPPEIATRLQRRATAIVVDEKAKVARV